MEAINTANYIVSLAKDIGESVTNMKLQKLLYYSFAWYLVENRNQDRLFEDDIEAWKYGPVVRSVYERFNKYGADSIPEPYEQTTLGTGFGLNDKQQVIIEDVYKSYGSKNAIELMQMTHNELPWRDTYEPGKSNIIDPNLIYNFYSQQLLSK